MRKYTSDKNRFSCDKGNKKIHLCVSDYRKILLSDRCRSCRIVASAREKHWIEDITVQFRERPIPNFYTLVDKPVTVHRTVKEGEQIFPEPGLTIRVLETPGHSPGSLSYILEESNVLFSGDAIPAPGDFPIFIDEKASRESVCRRWKHDGEHRQSGWEGNSSVHCKSN